MGKVCGISQAVEDAPFLMFFCRHGDSRGVGSRESPPDGFNQNSSRPVRLG